jgi:hypothetical protein
MRPGRPVHIQGAIEQAEADQGCMAPDVAIMFDELRAIADRLPSCTPTEAASGGCGLAGRRAGAGATAVVAAASRAMMTMHSFGNVARANPDLFWTPGQSRWAAFCRSSHAAISSGDRPACCMARDLANPRSPHC